MVVGDAYKSICRDNRSRRAYDDSPRDGGVARNGFGGGGGGGGGAAPEYKVDTRRPRPPLVGLNAWRIGPLFRCNARTPHTPGDSFHAPEPCWPTSRDFMALQKNGQSKPNV